MILKARMHLNNAVKNLKKSKEEQEKSLKENIKKRLEEEKNKTSKIK